MTIADLFNSAVELRWGERVFRCRKPSQIENGEFQKHLEQKAFDAIERRAYQDEGQREIDRANHFKDCAAGEYDSGSLLFVKAQRTPAGLAKMLQIVLRDQGMTEELAAEIVEHKFKEVAAAIMERALTDPKEVRDLYLAWGISIPHSEPTGTTSSSGSATSRSSTAWITSADSPSPNS